MALYGAPPKPSAGDVASVLKQGISDQGLSEDVLLKMSVARRGQETNLKRANAAADDINAIMEDISCRGDFKYAFRQFNLDKVHIGMLDNNTPVVACDRYIMQTPTNATTPEEEVTVQALQNQQTIQAVGNKLDEIFEHVQDASNRKADILSFVKSVTGNVNLGSLVAWADAVEKAINSPLTCVDEIVSRNSVKAKNAVQTIYSLVGSSYGRIATQLTSAQDIRNLNNAAETCYELLMADTVERAFINFVFYVSFKVLVGKGICQATFVHHGRQ